MSNKIAVLDFETDPFKYGRLPEPFAWGFFDGKKYSHYWQENARGNTQCVEKLDKFLKSLKEPHTILAHNGGRFDFLYMLKFLQGKISIVNGRILEARCGIHTLRDSFAILPVPLADSKEKLEIDYSRMELEVREKHKTEILDYLRGDCLALYNLVQAFYAEFGNQLTIGSTAMKQLKKFHAFEKGNQAFDSQFRPYYYGGRCQCFEIGIIDADIKVYDVNSSYPDTMKNKIHPVSLTHDVGRTITEKTNFVRWRGLNDNAVPLRTKTGLDFTARDGEFFSTIHEFNTALELDIIKPHKILETVDFKESISFADFIDHFYTKRNIAKAEHDVFLTLFYKLILNSAYGKFAQSPDNFLDSIILPAGEIPSDIYSLQFVHGDYAIWSKEATVKTYFNIATAASITGGARATLLQGIARAHRPIYCDTDSVFCESMHGAHDDKILGAWKLETRGDSIAIAGKKLYAIFDRGLCVKQASKGAKLTSEQIVQVARGGQVESRQDAPKFKLDGKHIFINRTIRSTTRRAIKKAA